MYIDLPQRGALMFASEEMTRFPTDNLAMVNDLMRTGTLRSSKCIGAFLSVERQHFWIGNSDMVFADMPLRHGRLHLSAPQIYAVALESLMPLSPGLSFLNVGFGTGYFSSLVSELTGELSTNHGIDIWPETLAHAKERCGQLNKRGMEFSLGNVYQLDVNRTMRYDRIYMGACATSRSKYLYRLLAVGGILVGPFQAGRTQQLRRVIRKTETHFSVEVLESVRFASLVEPPASKAKEIRTVDARRDSDDVHIGLPGVPFTFALFDRPWSPARAAVFPESFRRTVAMSLERPRDGTGVPREIWIQHIFPWCSKSWFEPARDRSVKRDGGSEMSDDDISTCAPSSQTTPVAGPDAAPAAIHEDTLDLDTVLFEVFGNGHRHVIGAEGDPDDLPDEGPHYPMQVLNILAEQEDQLDDALEEESDEEEEEEEAWDDGDGGVAAVDEGHAAQENV